jgi:hypothetical protein
MESGTFDEVQLKIEPGLTLVMMRDFPCEPNPIQRNNGGESPVASFRYDLVLVKVVKNQCLFKKQKKQVFWFKPGFLV